MGSSAQAPDEYEFLIEQLAASAQLIERLRAEPPSPKVKLSIARLVEARWRMLSTLAEYESPTRSS